CGTDLGLIRTRAVPAADGSYAITGTKIFISAGDHDLTDNIIHLVLAKLPDAPLGVKGISMFLVPKYLPEGGDLGTVADGKLGERNHFECSAIEHKMGLNGSATCVMNYDGATGWLVGEPHRGLQAMFSMMNFERLMVGQQGLSQAEKAYQNAAAYAKERLQSRSLSGAKAPDQPADPIIVHPDVRRMLLTTRALNESARALLTWISLQVDVSERDPDPKARERAGDLVALFTPVIKAYFTDYGSEACNNCLQVLGGHGYIREWGMEQLVRDARIAQIYEGANGIHALDLVGRKLPLHDGRLINTYLDEVDRFIAENGDAPELADFMPGVSQSQALLKQATDWIRSHAARDPEETGAASYDYLRLMALGSMAYMWARMAKVAASRLDGDNTGYYRNKLLTGQFYMKRLMPQTRALFDSLSAGADSLMAMDAEAF
ncbi:MAG: acyl-CoA dehydrogenase C-terminal domain-containing protein, partial [Gammaproteobacteria bacterium]|nr:acyl-CoA dehydrogenase C-terminal domain-containing protein [Gammaproteobacteria bacterium]